MLDLRKAKALVDNTNSFHTVATVHRLSINLSEYSLFLEQIPIARDHAAKPHIVVW